MLEQSRQIDRALQVIPYLSLSREIYRRWQGSFGVRGRRLSHLQGHATEAKIGGNCLVLKTGIIDRHLLKISKIRTCNIGCGSAYSEAEREDMLTGRKYEISAHGICMTVHIILVREYCSDFVQKLEA